ncbi:hypothetical protein Tco_0702772 [Tanacetum coccineum]|uniref:Uncharacterized protein n=1 Tax=Tanacetum coccineum TaxID=301880 RepID=A0ABQ4XYK2_9ASTR
MEETLSKFMGELAKRHEENSNLIKEIRASTDAAIRNQGALIKTLEIQIGQMSKNSTLMYDTRQRTIPFPSRLNDCYCEEKKGSYGLQFSEAYSYGASHIGASVLVNLFSPYIIFDMSEDIEVPLFLGRQFLSTAHAKIDIFKRKITVRVGEEKIIFKSVKPPSSLIKRVYMLSLRERMELDLEARLMGETFVLNRSLNPLFGDYIELNDLNIPLKLRRDQVDDLMPTIEEDFAVLEDMDAYRNEGIGDVIFGELFLREVGINARLFEGMITIYNGNEEVTYQMVLSHSRFKRHTNEQCNKIPPLLKDLAAKKLTMLVKYLQYGNLKVLES